MHVSKKPWRLTYMHHTESIDTLFLPLPHRIPELSYLQAQFSHLVTIPPTVSYTYTLILCINLIGDHLRIFMYIPAHLHLLHIISIGYHLWLCMYTPAHPHLLHIISIGYPLRLCMYISAHPHSYLRRIYIQPSTIHLLVSYPWRIHTLNFHCSIPSLYGQVTGILLDNTHTPLLSKI